MIGVVPHQRGQVESHREAGLPLREQITKARIGILGSAKARKLPHGPQAAAIHRGMNAARVRWIAWKAEILASQVARPVKPADRMARNGREGACVLFVRIFSGRQWRGRDQFNLQKRKHRFRSRRG